MYVIHKYDIYSCFCSLSLYQKEVPLLLKDPVSILIQIVLTLPETIEQGNVHGFVSSHSGQSFSHIIM